MQYRSYPSPDGTHHGKSQEYFDSIRSQPADSLKDRFLDLYSKIITNGKENGYLSSDGVPYHSVETLNIDYIDYGHETTSDTFSEYIWLTAMNIWATGGQTADFQAAWQKLETYIIPSAEDQPTCSSYDPADGIYCVRWTGNPDNYPYQINRNVKAGQDDLNDELAAVYGDNNCISQFYATHWLLDTDNIYGFGRHESGNKGDRNVYINTYARGPAESGYYASYIQYNMYIL